MQQIAIPKLAILQTSQGGQVMQACPITIPSVEQMRLLKIHIPRQIRQWAKNKEEDSHSMCCLSRQAPHKVSECKATTTWS
ncbi:hypothetical protein APHAL10511_008566, partial [Amanita phalloides]